MLKHHVETAEHALVYMTVGTCVTVAQLATLRTPPKGEFDRQVRLAQSGVDWITQFGVRTPHDQSLFDEIRDAGSVAAWAQRFRPASVERPAKEQPARAARP